MKTIGFSFLILVFLVLYGIANVVWGLWGTFILHELCAMVAFLIVIFEFRKPTITRGTLLPLLSRIGRWDLRMTATATVFAIFGWFGLLVMLGMLDDQYSKGS
jgi:hypothetical protein